MMHIDKENLNAHIQMHGKQAGQIQKITGIGSVKRILEREKYCPLKTERKMLKDGQSQKDKEKQLEGSPTNIKTNRYQLRVKQKESQKVKRS